MSPDPQKASVRVDRWLYAARVFKSRSLATTACGGGHVKIGGRSVKAHQPIAVGDTIEAQAPGGLRILEVVALAERRLSAPLARELYEDHSPPPPPPEEREPSFPAPVGRPSKRDRAKLRRLRGR